MLRTAYFGELKMASIQADGQIQAVYVHKTKTDLAVEALRAAILRGEIKPGEHLTVARAAKFLGMSSSPIREAIRILQSEGLISHVPHHGVRVADFSLDDAQEVYLLRAHLEELATKLATPRLTAEDLRVLDALQADMREAHIQSDNERFARLNADWHLRIYRAAGSRYLLDFILRLWSRFPWDIFWVVADRTAQSVTQHDELLSALRAGDPETAGRLMHEHILSGQRSILAYLESHSVTASGA